MPEWYEVYLEDLEKSATPVTIVFIDNRVWVMINSVWRWSFSSRWITRFQDGLMYQSWEMEIS